jgi:hypothetical protein
LQPFKEANRQFHLKPFQCKQSSSNKEHKRFIASSQTITDYEALAAKLCSSVFGLQIQKVEEREYNRKRPGMNA